MKYLPSILAVVIALSGLAAPQIQALVMAHPAASMVLAALYTVMSHMLPSPIAQAEPKADQ